MPRGVQGREVILAGDVGGTKIHLALFRREGDRLRKEAETLVATAATSSAGDAVRSFCAAQGARPDAAALGVAGPVVEGFVRGVNLPWGVGADEIAAAIGGGPVTLVNDLQASAHGLAELGPDDLVTLQAGSPQAGGNRGLVSPGTGLGECVLQRVGSRWVPAASEGGHADFAPRTDEEIELVRWLRDRYGRASVERVLSGPGLGDIYRWLRDSARCADDSGLGADAAPAELPSRLSAAALEGSSRIACETLRVWGSALGAEAGNHALRGLTLGGLFVGGGIPARVLPVLREPGFLAAFRDKSPHGDLLLRVPVHVVTRPESPLWGAARLAFDLLASR
jgi:glucokinase